MLGKPLNIQKTLNDDNPSSRLHTETTSRHIVKNIMPNTSVIQFDSMDETVSLDPQSIVTRGDGKVMRRDINRIADSEIDGENKTNSEPSHDICIPSRFITHARKDNKYSSESNPRRLKLKERGRKIESVLSKKQKSKSVKTSWKKTKKRGVTAEEKLGGVRRR